MFKNSNQAIKDKEQFIMTAEGWTQLYQELRLDVKEHRVFMRNLIDHQHVYIMLNDPAHQWSHLVNVLNSSHKCYTYHHEVGGAVASASEYFMAALFHDTFAGTRRENHHFDGAEFVGWIYQFLPSCWKKEINITTVYNMCRWHRSSVPAPKEMPLAVHLFAVADKGPMVFKDVIERSIAYQQHHRPNDDAVYLAFTHVKKKFGRDGYAFKDIHPAYLDIFGNDLEVFWLLLEDPTAEEQFRKLTA